MSLDCINNYFDNTTIMCYSRSVLECILSPAEKHHKNQVIFSINKIIFEKISIYINYTFNLNNQSSCWYYRYEFDDSTAKQACDKQETSK